MSQMWKRQVYRRGTIYVVIDEVKFILLKTKKQQLIFVATDRMVAINVYVAKIGC